MLSRFQIEPWEATLRNKIIGAMAQLKYGKSCTDSKAYKLLGQALLIFDENIKDIRKSENI